MLLTLLPACSVPAQQPVAPKPAPTAPDPVVASAKGAVPPAPPPGRPAPSRPALTILWPTTRLRNIEYVSLRDVAKNFDLKLVWSKADIAMTLSDARGGRFIFEGNQKDFYFDNLRVFLGVPAIFHKDSLWVSQLDVIKIIAPLFRPADHLAFLPAADRARPRPRRHRPRHAEPEGGGEREDLHARCRAAAPENPRARRLARLAHPRQGSRALQG
ncbi:MAG: hypothetical protein PSW75_04810 [bacterium]|nr:hypothetical protein [bacterium]